MKISRGSYATGFVLSLGLTLAAFMLVWRQTESDNAAFSKTFLISWLIALALAQLITQLVFFLHLGRESKPRWNLTVLSFAAVVVVILFFGSLWIMNNLRYHEGHKMTPEQTDQHIIEDEGIHQ
jgi:cytochrome o ubiquinol oxidase operon protein cyoD